MSDLAKKAVFLSYASQDAEAAKRICDALRAAGVEVWFDQSELRGGDAWDAKIRKRIKECALFVPVISGNTQARGEGYFRLEWKLAVDRSHLMSEDTAFLFPIVIDDVADATARVPDKFREVQWTRLRLDQTPAELAARVAKLLGSEAEVGRERLGSPLESDKAGSGGFDKLTASDPALQKKGKTAWLPYVLAAAGIGLAAVFALRPTGQAPHAPETKLAPDVPVATLAKPAAETPAVSDKSVAVLAFSNLSGDKDNEYFSDGISEELLTVLQKVPGLRVAARTSAFSFKGKNATAQEIGQKLGVAHLVEGSVQRSGTRVKVTAHLSRAATGEELWSQGYTRELKDVFALQAELALAIVGELRGQLAGNANATAVKAAIKGGTTQPEAYQQYLQGKFFSGQHSEEGMGQALDFYQRAVDLDPSFALAWAGLARAHAWLCNFSDHLSREDFERHAAADRAAVERALAIEPTLPEGLLARCEIQLLDYDWTGAGATLQTALALAPSDPQGLILAGNLAAARGDVARSTEYYRQAVALDPVNPVARVFLMYNFASTRQLAAAKAEYPRVLQLAPNSPWAHAGLGLAYLLEGNYEEAAVTAQKDAAEYARVTILAMARFSQKRLPEADAALAQMIEKYAGTAAYQIAEIYAYRGDNNHAFEWLERAHRQRDGGLNGVQVDPLINNLVKDSRWREFLGSMNLATDPPK